LFAQDDPLVAEDIDSKYIMEWAICHMPMPIIMPQLDETLELCLVQIAVSTFIEVTECDLIHTSLWMPSGAILVNYTASQILHWIGQLLLLSFMDMFHDKPKCFIDGAFLHWSIILRTDAK
jgi:hypothetical protein